MIPMLAILKLQLPEQGMTISLDVPKTKELMTEILVELLQQKREIFYDIVLEALEDVGLAQAIEEGMADGEEEWVDEGEIRQILQGESLNHAESQRILTIMVHLTIALDLKSPHLENTPLLLPGV